MKLLIDNNKKIIYTETVGTTFFNFFTEHINTKDKLFHVLDSLNYYLDNGYFFGLNYTNEGSNYFEQFNKKSHDINPFNWLLEYKELKNYKTPFFKILMGNLNIYESVPDNIREFFYPLVVMHHIPERVSDFNQLQNRNIEKKFVFLNARINNRYYRISTYIFLKGMGILDDCNYSFNSRNDFNYKSIWYEDSELIEKTEFDKREEIINKPSSTPFVNSFCNIVAETYFNDEYDSSYDNAFFMSEKIFKPIISCQPFLILSSPFYLKKMKELGFKTFDKWWDESYDNIECGVTRLSEIYKVIIKINNMNLDECNRMYREMNDVLVHNHNHAINFEKLYPQYTLPTIMETTYSNVLADYIKFM